MIKQILLIFILATAFIPLINAEDKSSKQIGNEINSEKQKEEKIRLEIDQLKKEIKKNDSFVKSKKNKLKEEIEYKMKRGLQ